MKSIQHFVAIFLAMFSVGNAIAQQTISGQIINSQNQAPIIGASILITNSSEGTTSDLWGKYSLITTLKVDSITVSYIGFESQTVAYSSNKKISLNYSENLFNQVIISANREAQKRKDAPIAITVLTEEQINEAKATSLEQVLNKVNGVYMVDLGNEQHSMSIRQPLTLKSLFLYLEDGLPIRPTGVFNHNALIEINKSSIGKIEVIKGPASSIYGSGAIGGAVNFISHKPTVLPVVKVNMQGNNIAYKKAEFLVSNTFKNVGIVASGNLSERKNGPRAHSDYNKLAFTLRGDWRLSDKTIWVNSTSIVDYKTDMTGGLDSLNFYDQNFNSLHTFTHRSVNALRFRSSLKHYWHKNAKTSITGFYRNNAIVQNPHYRVRNDFIPWSKSGDALLAHGEENSNSFTSLGGVMQHKQKFKKYKASLIAGLSIDYSPNDFKANYISISKNTAGVYTGFEKTDSLLTHYDVKLLNTATYVEYSLSPLKFLTLVTALRYDRFDYDYNNDLDTNAFSGAPDEVNYFEHFTPKVGATFDLGNGIGLYTNYAVGFSPPEISELYYGTKVPALKPATYNSYELGSWISFHKKQGLIELAIYQMDGTNEIVSVVQKDGSTLTENTGKTKHFGIESNVKYKLIDQINMRVSAANAWHTYVDYVENGNDYSGNKMQAAPEFILNTEVIYKPKYLKGFRIGLELQNVNDYYLDAANTEKYEGYCLLNLRLGYKIKAFDLWVNIMNFTDVEYATSATKSQWGKKYRVGESRTVNVGLSYKLIAKKKENNG
jgi:outer membrane receptor protein involved in Fe transport